MKINGDFVTNSSSSNFLFFDTDSIEVLFRTIQIYCNKLISLIDLSKKYISEDKELRKYVVYLKGPVSMYSVKAQNTVEEDEGLNTYIKSLFSTYGLEFLNIEHFMYSVFDSYVPSDSDYLNDYDYLCELSQMSAYNKDTGLLIGKISDSMEDDVLTFNNWIIQTAYCKYKGISDLGNISNDYVKEFKGMVGEYSLYISQNLDIPESLLECLIELSNFMIEVE